MKPREKKSKSDLRCSFCHYKLTKSRSLYRTPWGYWCGREVCAFEIMDRQCPEVGKEVKMTEFQRELCELLNKHSKENGSDTPDFILAIYLSRCLENFDQTVVRRRDWYDNHNGKEVTRDPG